MNTLNFSERLKYYREKANISKSELARIIRVSPSYITKLENGEKTNPSLEICVKIADVLNIKISDLLKPSQLLDNCSSEEIYKKTLDKYLMYEMFLKDKKKKKESQKNPSTKTSKSTFDEFNQIIISNFMTFVNGLGLDFFNDLSTNEISNVIKSEELFKTLEYLYFKEKSNRYNSLIKRVDDSLNELKTQKDKE